MIILDSDDDKDWAGKGVVVQHGCLVLIKDANFYHEIELYPGKHIVEIFGRKRTGQPTLLLEILDDSIDPISEFSADFEKSFLFKFEFDYKKTTKGYIRIFRPEKNFGTLEIVKVIINNVDLKEGFVLEKQKKKAKELEKNNAKKLIANDNKPKVEVSKEDERESRRLREVKESPRLQRYQRNNAEKKAEKDGGLTSPLNLQVPLSSEKPESIKADKVADVQPDKNVEKIFKNIPSENTSANNESVITEEFVKSIIKKESGGLPEQLAARIKQREERLSSRLSRVAPEEVGTTQKEPTVAEKNFELNRRIKEQNIAKREAERIARQEYLKSLELEKSSKEKPTLPAEEVLVEQPPPPSEPETPPSRPPVSSRNLFKNRIQGVPAANTESSTPSSPEVKSEDITEDKKE